MKNKRKLSLAFSVAGLIVALTGGFLFGFNTGRIVNDRDRIKKELSRMTLEEITTIGPVARSKEGKLQIRVFNAYLSEIREYRSELLKCNGLLKSMVKKEKDDITVFDVADLMNSNAAGFSILRSLIEEPEKYFREKLKEYGKDTYSSWIDSWSEDLTALKGLSRELKGHLTDIYEENIDYLDKITLLLSESGAILIKVT